jgi:hypothetical protein
MRITFVDNVLLGRTDAGYSVDLQPHLGLISLIAVLRERGHLASLYDPKIDLAHGALALGPRFARAAAERIACGEPEIVGFTSLGCNLVCTVAIARELRALRPDVAIVLGGPHATILDREVIERFPQFDVVARHEAEGFVAALVEALGGARPLAGVAGITYRERGATVRTADAPLVLDLDALPFPAYDAYPVAELGLRALRVDAGRGCPFGCTFCSTASFFGRRYRLKSAAKLTGELRRLEAAYGIREFALAHDLFTVSAPKVRAFCAKVRPYGYRWSCSARLDCVDDDLLRTMREAGCRGIYFGVETGSPRMQERTAKRLDLRSYDARLATSAALGIAVTASFITGYPGETRADQNATLALIGETLRRSDREVDVQLHLLAPEPGTALLRMHRDALRYDGHVTDWVFPVLDAHDEALVASEPELFVCHRYFDGSAGRANDVEVVEGVRALRALDGPILHALLANGTSFAALARRFGARLRAAEFRTGEALCALVEERFGAAHPFSSEVRFLAAHAALRPERRRALAEPGRGSLRLARCAAAVRGRRDGGEPWWLLLATPDLRGRASVRVDRLTFAIAERLARAARADQLVARFGAAANARLAALCLLGAVVDAERGERARASSPSARAMIGSIAAVSYAGT